MSLVTICQVVRGKNWNSQAYYNNPEIIFDEATVSLDSETEKQIFQTIKNFKSKKTIIVVTHKTELLSDADKLMVIKNGEVYIQ